MNNMLHTKLLLSSTTLLMTLSSPSFAADLELKPISDLSASYQVARACFLPDCENDLGGDINMDINNDTRWCEKKGYTYYSSGECPQYYKKTDTCKKDNHYLKCDANAWCKDNGYNTTSCSLPKFVDTQCPNGQELYKTCTTDNPRACKQLSYTNTCSGSQKLHASNGRCSYDNAYGTCCSPSGCPAYTSLTGTYGSAGSQDGCGYTCSYTCNMNCPSGTSTANPGGCGGSTRNGCNTKTCYYSYQPCCSPSCSSDYSCSCGTYTVSDGCGGRCTKCSACCSPYGNETGCSYGTYSCSNGCGGTRTCCSAPPPNPWKYYRDMYYSKSNYCWKDSSGWWISCTPKMYCVNSNTGAKNYICELGYAMGSSCQGSGWDSPFSSESECLSATSRCSCSSHISSGNFGSCSADGSKGCSYP